MFMPATAFTPIRPRPLTDIEFCAWIGQAVPGDRLERAGRRRGCGPGRGRPHAPHTVSAQPQAIDTDPEYRWFHRCPPRRCRR